MQNNLIYKALSPVNKLLEKYNTTPLPEKKSEEDIAWINSQINCLWENLKKNQIKGFESLREIRNEISHKKEDFSPEELTKMWGKVFPLLPQIKNQLEEVLEQNYKNSKSSKNPFKRKFKKFASSNFGDETERQQLLEAIEDQCNSNFSPDERIEFPENKFAQSIKEILDQTFANEENRTYVQNHPGLSKNIQNDLLDFIKTADKKISSENPFEKESAYISKLEGLSAEEVLNKFDEIQQNLKAQLDFDFYKKQIKSIPQVTEKTKKSEIEKIKTKKAGIAKSLLDSLKTDLFERKSKWELDLIDKLRKEFLKELLEKLENFKKLEKLLSGIFDETGLLWDLSKGTFKESGFEILKQYADLLEKDKSLYELAEILGKHNRAQKQYEKEMREKVVITTEYKAKPAFKGQIAGICTSNNISSVLPSELALLKNPATKKLFELKFAQSQLLSFKYENLNPVQKSKTEMEEISKEKQEEKGPIIICVDTSGSMSGTPENIAKTITFALTKIAIKEKRNCYLISFSTGIETLDLSSISGENSSGENQLSALVKFLRMSFNGGTDALPALNHALNLLQTSQWKNADLLMISDFCMGNLGEDLTQKIKAEQENKTDFYSLVIGTSGNSSAIECFNHNWSYNMNDPNASRHLVEQLQIL